MIQYAAIQLTSHIQMQGKTKYITWFNSNPYGMPSCPSKKKMVHSCDRSAFTVGSGVLNWCTNHIISGGAIVIQKLKYEKLFTDEWTFIPIIKKVYLLIWMDNRDISE